jgi:hypothetical protein
MKLQDYEWTVDGRPDGKLRKAGDRVKMTEAQAKYHVQMGHLEPAFKAASKTAQKAGPKTRKPRGKTGEPETAEDPATKTDGDEPEA